MQVVKPIHNKYVFHALPNQTYAAYVTNYTRAKKYGLRGIYIYVWAFGAGVFGICKEAATGTIRMWSREKLGGFIISVSIYCFGPGVRLVTNSTKVLKIANYTHTTVSYVYEIVQDSTNLAYLPIDLVLFGQPIPVGKAGRFNGIVGNSTDLFPSMD